MSTTQIPREALDIRETASVAPSSGIDEDGNVLIHVIRPTVGRGKGSHLYEAKMLKENAHVFGPHDRPDGSRARGWKMYVDHRSDEAKKKAGGLPRGLRDLGGRVVESWWDDSVPAEGPFERGAVVAKVKPTRFVRELIEDDPELVEASISASATGVRPGSVRGKKVWIVEGIADRGSVDWVTEAGAGGRVASIMESLIEEGYSEDDEPSFADLSNLSDDEFIAQLRSGSLEEAADANHNEEGPMAITPEDLREALATDEGRSAIKDILADEIRESVEEVLGDAAEIIRAEARADATRQVDLRDMRESAHAQIERGTKSWPQSWVSDLKGEFDIVESEATPLLDQVDEVDEDGTVVKSAGEKLTEAVEWRLDRQRKLLAEANPTRVRGLGAPKNADLTEAEQAEERRKSTPGLNTVLAEAGFSGDTGQDLWD